VVVLHLIIMTHVAGITYVTPSWGVIRASAVDANWTIEDLATLDVLEVIVLFAIIANADCILDLFDTLGAHPTGLYDYALQLVSSA
jgi:hypothetical protein